MKTLTLVLDGIAADCLIVATASALTSQRIRKSRNTVPFLRSGYSAVQPHCDGLVQVRVKGGKRSLVSRQQQAEWGCRVAAHQGARTASRDDRLGVLFPCLVVVVSAVVDLPVLLGLSIDCSVALGESGDNAGHGNGSDEKRRWICRRAL